MLHLRILCPSVDNQAFSLVLFVYFVVILALLLFFEAVPYSIEKDVGDFVF